MRGTREKLDRAVGAAVSRILDRESYREEDLSCDGSLAPEREGRES
jgi:hypothetical protein